MTDTSAGLIDVVRFWDRLRFTKSYGIDPILVDIIQQGMPVDIIFGVFLDPHGRVLLCTVVPCQHQPHKQQRFLGWEQPLVLLDAFAPIDTPSGDFSALLLLYCGVLLLNRNMSRKECSSRGDGYFH